MEGLEKLKWAKALIEEKTGGEQKLCAGWDGMPVVQIADGCMVGLYFALLKNRKTGFYDCRVKGYIRTCGGYNPSAWLKELTEEQFKTFLEKTGMSDHARRILDELTAQNAPTAPAQGAETAAQGNTPPTAQTAHTAREGGAGGSMNGGGLQG